MEMHIRLNPETDNKIIQAVKEIGSTKKFKSTNAILKRCIEKGLTAVFAETFSLASSKRGSPSDTDSDLKRLLKMQQNEIANLSIMLEIQERLLSFCYNTTRAQLADISNSDEVELSQLPERLAEIKRKALQGFSVDENNT